MKKIISSVLSCWLLLVMSLNALSQDLPLACGGSKVRYTVNGLEGSLFHWEVSTGGKIIEDNNNTVDIAWGNHNGIQTIKVTQYNSIGCIANPVYGYVMVSSGKLNLDKDLTICEGQTYLLKINAPVKSVLWNTGSADTVLVVSKQGYYGADVTFQNGCKSSDSTYLTVYANPVFSLGRDTTICPGEQITLTAGVDASSYTWYNGETTSSIVVKDNPGIAWAKVTDQHGCSFTDTIILRPCSGNTLKNLVPNAFTPNNDNDNDTWRIDVLSKYPEASVAVYNRWGQLVYKADKNYPSQGWDGKLKRAAFAHGYLFLCN